MERKEKIYYSIINIAAIILAVLWFLVSYKDLEGSFKKADAASVLIMIITVCLVHSLKAIRLYLVLYGDGIAFKDYLKIYCKVTPVSVVLPYKTGELFRMYCYGKELHNTLKGIAVILLDRFMDTLALVTTILLVWLMNGEELFPVVYLLTGILLLILMLYFGFPGCFRFWRNYLLASGASENKIRILRVLGTLNVIYREIEGQVKGKGVIFYIVSLLAWGAELGNLVLINAFSSHKNLKEVISGYLTSAISGSRSADLQQFVCTSIVLLLVLYVLLKSREICKGREGK